jgi:5'-3' exonuclease
MSTFAVVDLSNCFHRARHGSMTDAETKLGLALLIVFRSLRKMHRDCKVDHIVFCVDSGSWRYDAYPGYKARRRLMRETAKPAEQAENAVFFEALNKFTEYLASFTRCTVLRAEHVEGDDFVARWIARHPDDQHIIMSGDSDFVQLIAPNVRIYDAINQRMIGIDAIIDEKGRKLAFTVSPKDGKIKVGKPDPQFVPEDEWWRKALFIKLLRGDSSDSVFSAYPGVRYEGKKCSIKAAWEDRLARGYDWNNLMFQSWTKLVGATSTGEPLTVEVRVHDEYLTNERIIDLTMQPAAVIARMDQAIDMTLAKPCPSAKVGFGFLQFCNQYDQPVLAKEANDHVAYLNAGYPNR